MKEVLLQERKVSRLEGWEEQHFLPHEWRGTHLESLNYKCANVIKLSIFLQHCEIKEMKKFSFCKDVKQI